MNGMSETLPLNRPDAPTRPPEEILIEQCRRGDRQAFNRLVMQYQHLVYNFLYRLGARADDVEDLTQDVFLKVYRSLRSLKDVSQFTSWLHTIAVRVYVDDRRRHARQRRHILDEADEVVERHADPQADPSQTLARQELQEALQEAIDRLPEEFRLAIVLREIQGLSYDEIAAALRCSAGTVRSRIFRGRQLLRTELEEHIRA